jgi:hypothetical protein
MIDRLSPCSPAGALWDVLLYTVVICKIGFCFSVFFFCRSLTLWNRCCHYCTIIYANLMEKFPPRWSEHLPMSPVEGCPNVFQAICGLAPGIYQVPFFIRLCPQLLHAYIAFPRYMLRFISCANISILLPKDAMFAYLSCITLVCCLHVFSLLRVILQLRCCMCTRN